MKTCPTDVFVFLTEAPYYRRLDSAEISDLMVEFDEDDGGWQPDFDVLRRLCGCEYMERVTLDVGELWLDENGTFVQDAKPNPLATYFHGVQASLARNPLPPPIVGTCVFLSTVPPPKTMPLEALFTGLLATLGLDSEPEDQASGPLANVKDLTTDGGLAMATMKTHPVKSEDCPEFHYFQVRPGVRGPHLSKIADPPTLRRTSIGDMVAWTPDRTWWGEKYGSVCHVLPTPNGFLWFTEPLVTPSLTMRINLVGTLFYGAFGPDEDTPRMMVGEAILVIHADHVADLPRLCQTIEEGAQTLWSELGKPSVTDTVDPFSSFIHSYTAVTSNTNTPPISDLN
jgi:hypothetical protein